MYKLLFLNLCLCFFVGCSSSAQKQNKSEDEVVHHRVGVDEFKTKMSQENIVILDVRTPGEIANGKIEGALELDVKSADFETEVAKLDKDKTYLVYCQGGVRSNKACKKMEALGFKELYDLESGYKGWTKAAAN